MRPSLAIVTVEVNVVWLFDCCKKGGSVTIYHMSKKGIRSKSSHGGDVSIPDTTCGVIDLHDVSVNGLH